jgi:C4-dicarboxylate-specific signal transduction histidine kinase
MEQSMSEKYVFFSSDTYANRKLRSVFSSKEMAIKTPDQFPTVEAGNRLILIDGDALPPQAHGTELKKLVRKKIPVVYIFVHLSGREVMEILKSGAVSILFKDYSAQRIKKELKDILDNFNYLERVKDLAENDARTRKFLDVAKTLTSDNDINNIMISILHAMKEVFKLESTVFFIAAGDKLKQKIALGMKTAGRQRKDWDLKDPKIKWLKELRESRKPIYITGKSKKSYQKYFKENTLLLPLVIKDKFLGMIKAAVKPSTKKLSGNEITLLNAFAEQTAVALENAQLYRDVIKAREELVNQEKKSLLGQIVLSLNHEINNPLSIISMEAQMLQQKISNKEKKTEKRLSNIENNIERIKRILETISSLNIDNQIVEEYISGRQMLRLYNDH